MSESSGISVLDILAASDRTKGKVHKTPIMTSETINKLVGCEVFFKCELLQKTGSFKARGACNAVQKLKEEGAASGVVTHSSGNHGQGLAWAAQKAQVPCTVVVPKNAPQTKVEGMKAYDANIVLCEPTMKSREDTCNELVKKLNYAYVPPFDDPVIMAGQGTVAIEVLEQVPDVDAVFVAVGGGGMASGITLYVKETRPNVEVVLVQPEGKELDKYLESGQIRTDVDALTTVADGIRVLRVGENPFPVLKKYISPKDIVTVTDNEIREAVKIVWTRLKQRIEPTAGVPLAGLIKLANSDSFPYANKKVAIVLCGGNCDLDFDPNLMDKVESN